LTGKAKEELKRSVGVCLEALGIKPGDAVYLHSDAIVVGQFPGQGNSGGINAFLDAIEEYLGEKGTLIVPTFTYSFTKDEIYDVLRTPSTVGLITEVFRNRRGVSRSPEPIFSVAASGRDKELYAGCDPHECMGHGSTFEMLHRNSSWIVGMGCTFNRATFVHYVEKTLGVSYRYEKIFTGQRILADGTMQNWQISYYVRDLFRKSDIELKGLQAVMTDDGTFRKNPLKRVMTWAAKCTDIYDTARALILQKENSLIEEGN
jgi:aminoglycoside 3-N-acetyltransferase